MFFVKLKFIIALLLFLGVTANYAVAKMSDKFVQMDSDKNDSVSWDEFSKQYPQMKKGAFDSIDTDKDGIITKSEWQTFQASHSMDKANSPNQMPPKGDKKSDDGKPVIFMNPTTK